MRRLRFGRLWLRFTPAVEAELLAYLDPGVRRRAALLGTLVLTYAPAFVLVGVLTGRPGLHGAPLAWTVVAAGFAALLVAQTRIDLDPKRRQQLEVVLGCGYTTAVAATILSSSDDPYPYPFGGFVLVLVAVYLATGGDVYRNATVALGGTATWFVGAAVLDLDRPEHRFETIVVLAANAIGLVGGLLVEVQVRRSFLVLRQLSEAARTDPVTGLANRRGLTDGVERLWAKARRDGGPVAVVAVDLDHLKEVNDTLGHEAGDELLRTVAAELDRLRQHPLDVAARTGGDEFVVVRYGIDRPDLDADLDRLVRRVRAAGATVSAGAVHVGAVGRDLGATAVLDEADALLYGVKVAGRDGVAVADHETVSRR